jgi:signal transduction histidine kinase
MDNAPIRVLVVEGDADEAAIIASYLDSPPGSAESFALTPAARFSTARHLLARHSFDAILIDLVLPQSVGLESFRRLRELSPSTPIIVLTGLQDEPLAIQAVELGAHDYFIKGSPDCCVIKRAIRYALDKRRLIARRDANSAERLKRLEAEIKESLRMVEVKNHFMNHISHELRNTLSTLTTAAFCLRDGPAGSLTPQQSRLVDIIARNVDRQTKIVENVLDLARFQSGRLKIRFRPVDPTAIITEIVEECGLTGGAPKVGVAIEGRLPAVSGDPDLIAQVLRNLVDNALRFAREKVVVEASREGVDGLCVRVVDDGEGIAEERLGELFTEFVQLERTSSAPGRGGYKGTGLGLTICKEIVEGHRGRIWADNAPGRGARFSFVLPAAGVAQQTFIAEDLVAAPAGRPESRHA